MTAEGAALAALARQLEFFAPFNGLAGPEGAPVAVAVSGGSDSTALLLLAALWARPAGRPLLALTVDHGLRPEAAGEAEAAAQLARRIGARHRTLRWEAPRPGQARARTARHDLLARAAGEAGARLLLLGHTEDDQSETVLMRLARGSSPYGLAGIRPAAASPSAIHPALLLGRPLLGVRRSALRGWLAGNGIGWAEDPSNRDLAHERIQARQLLGSAEGAGLERRIGALSARLDRLRRAEDARLAQWLGQAAITARRVEAPQPDGPPEHRARAAALLVQLAARRTAPLRTASLLRLEDALGGGHRGATLGGAVVRASARRVFATPERGALDTEWAAARRAALIAALAFETHGKGGAPGPE